MSIESEGPVRMAPPNKRKTLESVERTLESADHLYFDSIIHMGVGPFVGKLTFGVQNAKDNTVQSATTITVPTSVLLDILINLRKALTTEELTNDLFTAHDALRDGLVKLGLEQP